MSFGFIIDVSNKMKGSTDYLNFLKSNHSAVFTDGLFSGIMLDNRGRIIKYFSAMQNNSANTGKHIPWTPYEFASFTNLCCTDNGANLVGIIMQTNGDMLVFRSKKLVFVKRNGKWMFLNSYTIHSTIEARYSANSTIANKLDSKKFADEVYLTLLDTSFAHTGGCIAIIDDTHVDTVSKVFFPNDALDNDKVISEKKTIIQRLISTGTNGQTGHYFQYLDRKLRLELLSLDGATVLNSSGKILCVGAIVRISGGSEGGGRTAAAKELAKYGLAMKISMDGSIQCFASAGINKEPAELFKTL